MRVTAGPGTGRHARPPGTKPRQPNIVIYRIWARLFTVGALAFLLLAALVFFAAAGGIWFNGGALNQ